MAFWYNTRMTWHELQFHLSTWQKEQRTTRCGNPSIWRISAENNSGTGTTFSLWKSINHDIWVSSPFIFFWSIF
ncbi:hypothetical protein NE237_014223 [Protea cynaroides]|uniref:Uncharacterized protein n=1 Tax=Protea cynaroides TaxID=273540 RepID=A0A9Q0JTA1_9MAGN|nr:hypothetical protein NE237_014223 [Protea cynaroides]